MHARVFPVLIFMLGHLNLSTYQADTETDALLLGHQNMLMDILELEQ